MQVPINPRSTQNPLSAATLGASLSASLPATTHPTSTVQSICCPNCGSRSAERRWFKSDQTVRTQCPDCDYLLISCSVTANVVEAYFPSQAYRQDIIPISRRR